MRIVVVNDFGTVTGGASKVAIVTASSLAARGFAVDFVCAFPPIAAELQQPGIAVHCLGQPNVWAQSNAFRAASQGIWNAAAKHRLAALMQMWNRRDTVIHFHSWTKAFSPSILAVPAELGFSSVVTLHDYFVACPNGAYYHFRHNRPCTVRPMSGGCFAANCDSKNYAYKLIRLARQFAVGRALRGADWPLNVIHVSRFARSVIEPFLPERTRHFVVRNAIDTTHAPAVAVGSNRLAAFVGRTTPEKGVALLATAAARANVPVAYIGEGPEEPTIRQLNPAAEILPWGDASAVDALLQRARVLVFPSLWYETAGLVVAEALARGVPVIAARSTGFAELIEDGVNGLLWTPGDEDDLVACLERLKDDDLATRMGASAHQRYWADPLSRERHAGEIEAVYRSILDLERSS